MILHHFTALENLPGIARTGLSRGDVPTSPTGGVQAVWFTTDEIAKGHGLRAGGIVPLKMRQQIARTTGKPVPAELRFMDKTRVRLTVDIDAEDLALRQWNEWAIAHGVTRQWRKVLDRTGGGRAHTWWLYFDTVPAERLLAIDTQTGEPLPGWPHALAQIELLTPEI